MNSFLDKLKLYFETTSDEKIQEDWSKSAKFDKIGVKVDDFIEYCEFLNSSFTDDLNNWSERLVHKISEQFYNDNEVWIDEDNGLFENWLYKLFKRGKSTSEAVMIIERAFNIYVKNGK